MKTAFKNTTIAVLAAATLATAGSFATVSTAEAGGRDFWAGAGAGFITGVIVNESARRHRYREPVYVDRHSSWDAHVSWCYDRYRTYSHHDNRYTVRAGYRRTCRSPYL